MGVSEKRQNFHFGVEYPFNCAQVPANVDEVKPPSSLITVLKI